MLNAQCMYRTVHHLNRINTAQFVNKVLNKIKSSIERNNVVMDRDLFFFFFLFLLKPDPFLINK